MDDGLVSKIGDHIYLDISALQECSRDTIIVDFEKFKQCGNDPTTYIYSDSWTSPIKSQLTQLGFNTVLFGSDSFNATDSLPHISITCYLKDNDFFSTKITLHFIYQKYFNFTGENIVVKDVILKLKNNKWFADT